MATVKRFYDLEVFKLARELHKDIFILLKTDGLKKDFELSDQMKRSAGSIMDNIAEGFGRGSRLEFIHFLGIAKASATELQSQIYRCRDREYIDDETQNNYYLKIEKIASKIGAFIRYLNKSTMKGEKFLVRNTNTKHQTPNAQRETRTEKQETINTSNAAKPLGAYPHARQVGNLLFLSGIGSRSAIDNKIPGLEQDVDGNITSYDIEAETHSCFANVKAVLEASGSSWDKIVDVTVFLTNMKNDFQTYNKIYGEYFKDIEACRTTVEVKSLPTPIAIELKVIATID